MHRPWTRWSAYWLALAETYKSLRSQACERLRRAPFRDASNQLEFLARASAALGTSVEIVSGREEARLIHRGVVSRWPQAGKRVLIVDIGGGSAEIIASEDDRMADAVRSLWAPSGCSKYFSIRIQRHRANCIRWRSSWTRSLVRRSRRWARNGTGVIATSATAAAVVCAVNRVARSKRDQADRLRASTAQIRQLYRKLSESDLAGRRKIAGIGPRRAEIIVAGAGTLLRILERFHASSLYYCSAGVRDGILADMAARNVGVELARLGREQRKEVERVASRFVW